jgi:hypothetical protein
MRKPTTTCQTPISMFWHEDGNKIVFEAIDHTGAKRMMFDVFVVPDVLNDVANTAFVVKDYFTSSPIAYSLNFGWIERWVHEVYGMYPSKAPDNKSIFKKKDEKNLPIRI